MSFLNVTVTNEARLLGQEKMAHFCHSLARSSQRRAQITWRVNVLAAGESLIICYLLVVIPIIRINNRSLCIRAKNSGLLEQTYDIYTYSHDHEEHMIRPHTAHLSFAASSIAMGLIMCISMNVMN